MTVGALDDLYREIILDHYRTPRNRGELPSPPATRVEGFNPLCGDEVTLYLVVRDGRLEDIRVTGEGCSISQSSASLMTAAVKGRALDEVRETIGRFKAMMSVTDAEPADPRALGELAALSGVSKFPVRIKCATLAWNTLVQGLDEAAAA
ncbi:MAG TPA: SUF system NifU family Fe-S cluster assembly protein [Acidimicrobiales bacterium]|nr:SUF system NifU family Fe-S cluster assembly protein [Acidimicrobiales bacterium]